MVELTIILAAAVVVVVAIGVWQRWWEFLIPSPPYMKMNPPPDVDKAAHGHAGTDTCWQATAANMLAGAGYGNGNTVQARADDIYTQMVNHFGTGSGWTDTALSWWLASAHNTWNNNRYTDVTLYGHKDRIPWVDANGARFMGNELRRCQFLGVSISWPRAGHATGERGHAITGWGDEEEDDTLTANPDDVRVTDSDRDTGGDVQSYDYDVYTNPNPGGANHGNGWYIDYSNNHPFIKHIVTLCPTDDHADNQLTQKVVGTLKVHQYSSVDATDLHYRVGTDTNILSYKTTVDRETDGPPTIVEDSPRRGLTVDWEFSKPVPRCTDVTITTEFILAVYNAIEYDDVHFTYPEGVSTLFREFKWMVKTPEIMEASVIPNVSGGYVVASFDLVSPDLPEEQRRVAEYRFIHEYSYNQSPEEHLLLLSGEKSLRVSNLKIGHSYGYLPGGMLWEFKDWMTEMPETYALEEPVEIEIDWSGRLPYPEGETIRGIDLEKGA